VSLPSPPSWLVDLAHHWPWLLPVGLVLFGVYRFAKDPVAFATFISVLGPKAMRDDAHRTVQTLCNRESEGPPALNALPNSARRTGRRSRRKRRR
jgi:hypothetical protein